MSVAQGKLHSSPFHVESRSYIYAIEHEGSDYKPHDLPVMCDWLDAKTHFCNLWNSGYALCQSHKCPFHLQKLQRENAECTKCAFWRNSGCEHPDKPINPYQHLKSGGSLDEKQKAKKKTKKGAKLKARYCTFYFTSDDNPEKYTYLITFHQRQKCMRSIQKYRDLISGYNRFIKRSYAKIANGEIPEAERKTMMQEIHEQIALKKECRAKLDKVETQLRELGGPLDEGAVWK